MLRPLVPPLKTVTSAANATMAYVQRRLHRARARALTDALTGIGNRRAWDALVRREAERCRRDGTPACMFVVDLKAFKAINDTLGRAAGDGILRAAATTLQSTFRPRDVVARTGSDEFSVLAPECDGVLGELLLVRLNVKLAKASISASVGYGFPPAAGIADLRRAAYAAMHAAKRDRSGLSRTA